MALISEDELQRALADAIAVSGEFDELEGRLACFGLDALAVVALLEDRWDVYRLQALQDDGVVLGDDEMLLWTRAYLEGLLTARKLPTRCPA